jgi:hypothetical protein
VPSHFPFLPPRVRHWFAHSDPMTRREFYALFAILFGLITFCFWGLKHLSDSRVIERKAADYRGCVFVREHVVLPDRATVLTGPYNSAPILVKLGFSQRQINDYLKNQYGGVDPKLLEAARPNGLGLSKARALELTAGEPASVKAELDRRPIPVCTNPSGPRPPGSPSK